MNLFMRHGKDQDSLNAAAGGNLLEKSPQDALTIIENKSKVKAVEEICVTCGGAHPYYQCLAAGGNTFPEFRDNIQGYISAATGSYNQGYPGYRPQGPRTLPGYTIANPKGELKAITTRSGLVTDGPTIPNPPKSVNLEEDECVEETYTDPDHAEYTIKENSEDIFSFGSALEDFICVVIVLDGNIVTAHYMFPYESFNVLLGDTCEGLCFHLFGKVSSATIKNLTFPGSFGKGPTMSMPYCIKGHVAVTEVMFYVGNLDSGEWI
uniref:Reverse transcriptase domain-containing protein n=1 Tax=Tanacetum cinerariifolium TaxID=118510 RepID=A0A6L2NPP9_TANCI|nr:hypothetical protein [Tanacetum cinerariifolium]